ncbi:MAG: cytochrome P450 [Phycisphaeraceae bacterium]|nr:cytochrome P450 [Phycisphaeraceae bacterium]
MTTNRDAIDLLSPEFYVGDPHPAYRWMRENEPVFRDEKNALWGITTMADIRNVERMSDLFISSRGYRSTDHPAEDSMIKKDDPGHAEQRKLISARFTPRAVRQREDEIREIVVECLERIRAQGSAEVVDSLAARIPATLTCRLLGFPDSHWSLLDDWSAKLMRVDRLPFEPRLMNDSTQAFVDMSEAAFELYESRRREPRDDLMSLWAHADLGGGPMKFETIQWELGLVIPGGVDTTRTTIARSLILLSERPDLWAQMAKEPSRIPGAVEELLRFITPLNNMFRTAARDVDISGQEIAADDRLCLLYPSANRDDSFFEDPDEIRFDRSPNPHVAFGLGTHFCLGANLARLTLRVFFEELTKRLDKLEAIAPPEYEANVFIKGVRRFDVAFESA